MSASSGRSALQHLNPAQNVSSVGTLPAWLNRRMRKNISSRRALPDQPTGQANVATTRRPLSECHTFDSGVWRVRGGVRGGVRPGGSGRNGLWRGRGGGRGGVRHGGESGVRGGRGRSRNAVRVSHIRFPENRQAGFGLDGKVAVTVAAARAQSRSRSECHLSPRVHSLAGQRSPKRPRDDVSSNSNFASVSVVARPPSAAVETLANELLRRCAGLPPTERMKPNRVKGQSFALHESQQLLVVFNDPTAPDVSMRRMRVWFGTKNTMFDVNFTHEIRDGHFVPLPPRTLVCLPCSGIQYWSMVTLNQ